MFMCKACGELFDNHFKYCPKADCRGGEDDIYDEMNPDIICVDDAFAPVVQMMQKKGFDILDCDFGNGVLPCCESYIDLDPVMTECLDGEDVDEIFSSLPEPWRYRIGENGVPKISMYIFGKNAITRHKEFLKAHLALAEWIENEPRLIY